MPKVINVSRAEDQRDVVHRAVQSLAEGKLVAFPTETVYGIASSLLNEEGVRRLRDLKERPPEHPFTLAVKSADDALDYIPGMTPLAQRLARRCWPGPVTLVLDNDHPDSVIHQLSPFVQKAICPSGTVGLRVPAHPLILDVLKLSAGALALASANRRGEADAVTAKEVVQAFGDAVDLVLDDGRSRFAQPSSVIRVHRDNRLQVLRLGVIGPPTLKRLGSLVLLFICTGNTCRSPMAEALMRRRLADKLGCSADELEDAGVLVMSAGIAAMAGGRCSPEAAEVMKQRGLDLTGHESQPLTDRLVRYADLILTMTRGHREAILGQWPEAAARVRQLCPDAGDISDPIGGPPELYESCADQIDAHLAHWVEQLDLESIPKMNTDHGGEESS